MDEKNRLMPIQFKKTILSNKKLKDEMFVAFGLIFLTLLVLVGYLFPGIASVFETKNSLSLVMGIVFIILIIGFMIISQIVEPIIKISKEAKRIAKGDFSREIQITREDELGDLGISVDTMRRKIRDDVEKLKDLSETTESLRKEINRLSKEIEKFEVVDGLTGLFNDLSARRELEAGVRQAVNLHKSCSFVLLRIDRFEEYRNAAGPGGAEGALVKIASILKENITDDGKAARFSDHEFALILSGKNKKDAIAIAEETIGKIKAAFASEKNADRRLTSTAVVVENPIDGATAEELILKTDEIFKDALTRGGNRVFYQREQ